MENSYIRDKLRNTKLHIGVDGYNILRNLRSIGCNTTNVSYHDCFVYIDENLDVSSGSDIYVFSEHKYKIINPVILKMETEMERRIIVPESFNEKIQNPFYVAISTYKRVVTYEDAVKSSPNDFYLTSTEDCEWLISNTKYTFDHDKKEGVFMFKNNRCIRLTAAGYIDPSFDFSNFLMGEVGCYWCNSEGTLPTCLHFDKDKASIRTMNVSGLLLASALYIPKH